MFSVAMPAMPYHTEHNVSPRQRSASQTAASRPTAASPPVEIHGFQRHGSLASQQPPANISDLLEPAVEGPPSPERLRQLSKEAKRASHLNRGHGRRTASSGSSSLLSLTGDQAYDNMSLTRRSSNRSTTSRSSSRDRPDSVQVLGKNVFHRRGMSKRDSSANSSSGSSLYSTEITNDNTLATLKETLMPTIFSRRKSSRDDSAFQKKAQISGPFNFQHLAHTQRDQLVGLQRENRMDLASEFSAMRAPMSSAPATTNGSDAQGQFFFNSSSEDINNEPLQASARPPLLSRRTAPLSGARRLIKHVRSQEQLRTSPQRPVRPPRSPIEPAASPTLPPVPPPRVSSSRQSVQQDGDPLTTASLERPRTSGGFRRPQPFSPDELPSPPPATSQGFSAPPDAVDFPVDETRFSHAATPPNLAAWPLGAPTTPSFETPLPDVPEEEEQLVLTRRSRVSLASNNSSLRGSQSVPVLRSVAQAHRPMSGASDTLGCLDESPTHQRTARAGEDETASGPTSPIRESWEDDIDYCYEHEADANFNYEWERPSMDVGREALAPGLQVALVDDELKEATFGSTAHLSPGMLSASRFDVPALSPVSQASTAVGHEALTPSSALSVTNNFSFPRLEKAFRPSNLRHSRSGSQASSFKESHGFTLSPSLLIPNDYHQQMLLSEAERQQESAYEDEFLARSNGSTPYDDASMSSHHSPVMFQSRSSISTMATSSTNVSDSTAERHISTNSTWTALTRFTSSTSLNKMTGSWSETPDQVSGTHLTDAQDDTEDETTPPASTDTVPELTPFPSVALGRKSLHKSHASESVARDEVPPMKSAEAIKTRRPRARTTSLSTQAPPVGQYALFPRTYVKGNGDRI